MNDFFGFDFVGILILLCILIYLLFDLLSQSNIWVEFTSIIRARLNHIKAKYNWWTYRDAAQLVPKTITKQNLEDIKVEQSILAHPNSRLGVPRDQPSSYIEQVR
jgi:hypothetical protein